MDATEDPVGLVLSGGGARGAYEAGVLAELSPVLERRGERPTLFVGTSVGAITAAYLASSRHLPVDGAVAGGLERWRSMTKDRVMRPLVTLQAPLNVLRYAGDLLGVPGARLSSLLDPAPLERTLPELIDFRTLRRNVAEGIVDGAAVVATAARTGRSVVFTHRAQQRPLHRSHVVEYVSTALMPAHVMASAAIPLLFPPVRIEAPRAARGWYVDGGTRLNTPIKPGLDLGAGRLVVIGMEAMSETQKGDGRHDCEPPDLASGAAHLIKGALADPLVEDLRLLGNINTFFAGPEHAPAARAYREARGKPPYRSVPYIFIAPRRAGAIGALATEIFRSRYRGLRALRSPDFAVFSRLLGGEGPMHGELLSFLFFDPEFIEELIAMGRADARQWLSSRASDELWQVGPLGDFGAPGGDSAPGAPVRGGRVD